MKKNLEDLVQYVQEFVDAYAASSDGEILDPEFNIPESLNDQVAALMQAAAAEDAETREITLPADPFAKGGKWVRAALAINWWIREEDKSLPVGSWTVRGLLDFAAAHIDAQRGPEFRAWWHG